MPSPPPAAAKRKKWNEEEERTLISKYADLQSDGTLARLRTREKKFRPIADHVTASHHAVDHAAYPFTWTWKDACTKVQNMRHQYLLVKQKLIAAAAAAAAAASAQSDDFGGDATDSSVDTINWVDGLSLWSNFIRYKQVFGDAPLPSPANGDDLGSGLGFDRDDGEGEGFDCGGGAAGPAEPPAAAAVAEVERKKMKTKKKKKREVDRKVRLLDEREREWEDRMDRRRAEWRKRVEEMLSRHRVQMSQIQTRVLSEQQAVIGQLLGIISNWSGAGGVGGMACEDNSAHMNGMMAMPLPGENRGGGGGSRGDDGHQDDQFILDG